MIQTKQVTSKTLDMPVDLLEKISIEAERMGNTRIDRLTKQQVPEFSKVTILLLRYAVAHLNGFRMWMANGMQDDEAKEALAKKKSKAKK
jgi:hypothetical protein